MRSRVEMKAFSIWVSYHSFLFFQQPFFFFFFGGNELTHMPFSFLLRIPKMGQIPRGLEGCLRSRYPAVLGSLYFGTDSIILFFLGRSF